MNKRTILKIITAIIILATLVFAVVFFTKNRIDSTCEERDINSTNFDHTSFIIDNGHLTKIKWNKDSCLESFAVANQDISICDKIQQILTKNQCYLNVALAKQDPSNCEKIEINITERHGLTILRDGWTIGKEACYSSIAVIKEDISICDNMQEKSEKYLCISNVAITKQNLSICDIIQDQVIKNDCYSNVSIFRQALSMCGPADYYSSREPYDCLLKLVVAYGDKLDQSICEKIQDPDPRYISHCYEAIALAKRDTSICDKSYYKIDCYQSFVAILEDIYVCYMLKNQRERDKCFHNPFHLN
ncbi:MAG: hypothetical protein NTW73_00405 [Candidatus Parcubacteria bacterium]|nr:hypothetical protein [Candidatus Parcubacteria bacterium]